MDPNLKAMLDSLSEQLKTMQSQWTTRDNELQSKMNDAEKANQELRKNLELTNLQVTSALQREFPESSANPPNTTTTSAEPKPGFSGGLSAQFSGNNQVQTNQAPVVSYSTVPIRKHLVALPKFEGDPRDWLVFLADYKRTTEEYQYTSSENTTRLNDCLKGKARELVQWLLIHSDMADKIVERLQSRFGRPELLVDAQLTMLRAIPRICDSKIEQIVPFADKVINFSHFMLATACEHHLSNPTLLNELVLKLPMSTRVSWATHTSTLQIAPTIMDFSKWIEVLADNIARVPLNNSSTSQPEKKSMKSQLFHATTTSSSEKQLSCSVCANGHFIEECPEFLRKSVDDRWTLIREKKLCFSCLFAGHSVRNCRRRKSCNVNSCKRVHHAQLHSEPRIKTVSSDTARAQSDSVLNCHATSKESTPKVLFKMLPVKVYNGDKVVTTYALFDEGSIISLMDKNLANRIGLSGSKRNLKLQWFANVRARRTAKS